MDPFNAKSGRRRAPALAAAGLLLGTAAPFCPAAFGQAADQTRFALLEQYCTECHNATDWAGGVAFDTLTAADVPHDTKLWEGAVRKMRGHLMPPPGSKQPTAAEASAFVGWLETSLDARKETPRAGHVTAQRLNRTEYANAVRTLLGVEVKVEDLLPPEIEMDGFDNIAAALTVSPAFLEQYISAARFIAGRAMGSAKPKMGKALYLPAGGGNSFSDGMPLGSRGGMKINHFFPSDGEYKLNIQGDMAMGLYSVSGGFRSTLVILVDGAEVFRADVGGKEDLGLVDREGADGRAKLMQRFSNIPLKVKAGTHEVVVTFVERSRALSDDYVGVDQRRGGGEGFGEASVPQARLAGGVEITGPYGETSISSTVSRDRILVCQPKTEAEERPCAERIARELAHRAYRRPIEANDMKKLMRFYDSGRKDLGSFDGGVQEVVMAVLSSPDFLYRAVLPRPGADHAPYRLSDLELASRLSFFLWSDLPDVELLKVAEEGRLSEPAVYDAQVKRMLTDKRASALASVFAMRWLNVDDLTAVDPDLRLFPGFSDALRQDFSTEIQLFLSDVLLENRSVVELLSSDTTFLNERLAGHYGMKNVFGPQFRKVKLTDPNRRGLLGKAAVLLRTSYGDRTSPVLRGAWVLEKLMGTPPTPPPPGVETNLTAHEGAAPTTLRARLEIHREARSCNQCHGVIDPIGLAMENFDVTGAWRTKDTGLPVNAATVLPDGKAVEGVAGLREDLLSKPQQFVQTIAERLMMYATGRELEPGDMPQIRQIVRDSARDNYRFFSIIDGIVHSDAFRMQGPAHATKNEYKQDPTKVVASLAPAGGAQ